MKRLLVLLSFATLSAWAAAAAPDAATSIRAVIDEYETAVRANTQKIIDAKTEEERNRYRGTVPSVAPYAAKVMKLVRAHADDAGSAQGVSWLVTQASAFPEGQTALQMLGTSHVARAGIAEAVKALEYHPLPVAEPVLRAVREKNPHKEEKAAATYALGVHYFRQYESAAAPAEAEAARDKATELFQEVTTTFADAAIRGFPLADQASRMLFEMTNLAVGVEAPDIEGSDVDGSRFKLSDYRGGHVVLMFWGGWCHACHGVIPHVNELATRMKGKPVTILGINTDIPDEARQAYQEYEVNFRNWSDGTTGGPITTLFNLRNFPTFYLVDPKGVIVLKNTSLQAIEQKLAALE